MVAQLRWTVLFLIAAVLGAAGRKAARAAEPLPNVVLIFTDDLGYGDLSCYGATKLRTPNIDRLAREGRRFTDAHSASAVCTPSRYALLTGEYPIRALGGRGAWGPLSPTSGLIIDTKTLTIGKAFQNKGYATACLGKWHLGFKQGDLLATFMALTGQDVAALKAKDSVNLLPALLENPAQPGV